MFAARVARSGRHENHLVESGRGVGLQPRTHSVEVADQADPARRVRWQRVELLRTGGTGARRLNRLPEPAAVNISPSRAARGSWPDCP